MSIKAAAKRLSKEYASMQKEPPPFVWAVPDERDILTWNYIIRGPADSLYAGGEYHGVLLFPPEYPFKPPGIKMLTPSGRFQTDKRICFSMSDFHPGTWNPAWSVATILTGLLSFMLSDEMTTGGLSSSDSEKRILASKSHTWNILQRKFKDAFPDYCGADMRNLPNMGEKERGKADVPTSTSTQSSGTNSHTIKPPSRIPAPFDSSAVVPTPGSDGSRAATNPFTPKPQGTVGTWAAGWRHLIWEKWRWGALIAIAVVVSRLSSGN